MKKWLKSIPLQIWVILFIALVMRMINLTFGSPVLYTVPDEVLNYMAALTMLKEKTLLTTSQYPPFGSYIQLPFFILSYLLMLFMQKVSSINNFLFFLSTHEGYFLFIPRLISAVFGTASLVFVYQTAKIIFPRRKEIAFWALLIIGFSITHLQISSLGKPNMPALFFYCVGLYYLVKSTLQLKYLTKNQLLSLIFFSIGGGFHFSSIFGVVLFFLVCGFFYRKTPFLHVTNFKLLSFVLIPIGFLIGYALLSSGSYPVSFTSMFSIFLLNLNSGFDKSFIYYVKEFAFTEPILFIMLGLSVIYYRLWPKIFKPLALFTLFFSIYIIVTFFQSIRYLLPALVIWSFFAAFALDHLLMRINYVKQIIKLCLIIILVFPSCLWLNRYLTQPTFIQAKSWVEQNIPPQTQIASTSVRFSAFIPDKNSVIWMRQIKPNIYSLANSVLKEKSYPENVRAIIYLDQIINMDNKPMVMSFLNQYKIIYLLQYYWDPQERLVSEFPHQFQLVKRFSPLYDNQDREVTNVLHGSGNIYELSHVKQFGPYIDILQLIY